MFCDNYENMVCFIVRKKENSFFWYFRYGEVLKMWRVFELYLDIDEVIVKIENWLKLCMMRIGVFFLCNCGV